MIRENANVTTGETGTFLNVAEYRIQSIIVQNLKLSNINNYVTYPPNIYITTKDFLKRIDWQNTYVTTCKAGTFLKDAEFIIIMLHNPYYLYYNLRIFYK